MSGALPHVVFRLGRQAFALPLTAVKDVARGVALTAVPHARPEIRGLAVAREQLAVVVDLRARLGLPMQAGITPTALTVEYQNERVTLLVDRMDDVVSLVPTKPAQAPRDLHWQGVIDGMTQREAETIIVLNVAGLIEGMML